MATFDFRYQRIGHWVLIGFAVFVLLVSINSIRMGFQYQRRILDHRQKISQLETNLIGKRSAQKAPVAKDDAAETEKKIVQVSQMVARDVFPFDRLLDMLEDKLPAGIQLQRLEANEKIGLVVLEGVAKAMDRVTLFIKQLESLDGFSKIALAKLTFDQEKKGKAGQGPQQIVFVIEGTLVLERILPLETYGDLASVLTGEAGTPLKEE